MPLNLEDFSIFPAQVPPPELVDAVRLVDQWCTESDGGFGWFALTPLSTFFDPDIINVKRPEFLACVREGLISIALVRKDTHEHLIAAIVSKDGNRSAEVTDFLAKFGVRTYPGDEKDALSLRKFLDGLTLELGVHRGQQSNGERWLVEKIRASLQFPVRPEVREVYERLGQLKRLEVLDRRASRFLLLREVSLGAMVNYGESSTVPAHQRAALWSFRCDALVVTAPPVSTPVLVVEFDGAGHLYPEKAGKDAFRDKFLVKAGISVLRVSSATPSLANNDFGGNVRNLHRYDVENFLQYLVTEIAHDLWYWSVEYPRESDSKNEWIRSRLDSISGPLDTEVFEHVLHQADERFAEYDCEMGMDRHLQILERTMTDSWEIVGHPANGRAMLRDVRVSDNNEEYVMANGILAYQDGRVSKINTPQFFVSLSLPPGAHSAEDSLVPVRRQAAIHSLVEQALMRASLVRNP